MSHNNRVYIGVKILGVVVGLTGFIIVLNETTPLFVLGLLLLMWGNILSATKRTEIEEITAND